MTADSNANKAIEPGEVIKGKYRVERLLAEGGMGAVYKARHEVLDQDVAIKFMHPEIAANHVASQRFLREARAAAAIQSDYVARVTDVDMLDDGTPFMVMEFLRGRDLDAMMSRSGRLTIAQGADLIMQALAGVQSAHEIGVVHRDLKPSNLFVTTVGSSERVKVLDFGISKVLDDVGSEGLKAGATTGLHATLGTPRYMSPEQIRSSKDVDIRTDLWAMGLILYEALTGAFPFEGDTAGEILAKVIADPIEPIRSIRPDVPLELADVIHRCLERDRDKRFSSTKEMMVALAPFASKRIVASVLDEEDFGRASSPDLGRASNLDLDRASDPNLASGGDAANKPIDVGAATMPFAAGGVAAGATAGGSSNVSTTSDAAAPSSAKSWWPWVVALGVGGSVIGVVVAMAMQPDATSSETSAKVSNPSPTGAESPSLEKTSVTPTVSPTGEPSTTATAVASASAPLLGTAIPKPTVTAAAVVRPPIAAARPPPPPPPPPPQGNDSSDVLGTRE